MINNKICILIVDDETRMLRGLKDFLVANKYHILIAENGQEALDIFYENNNIIDLILLDVMMPILNGYDVLKDIRANKNSVPVIMLTALGEEFSQLSGFEKGADDYIVKPYSLSILLARIEAVLKRSGKTEAGDIILENLKINSSKRMFFLDDTEIDLTKREFDLLLFLMNNQTRIFSREQLLNSVWGYDFDGDFRTVDTHIKQIRIKLLDSAKYIKTVHGVGYKLEV